MFTTLCRRAIERLGRIKRLNGDRTKTLVGIGQSAERVEHRAGACVCTCAIANRLNWGTLESSPIRVKVIEMVKLLVAGVLVAVMGVMISRLNSSSTSPSDPVGAQQQVDKARQNINNATTLENQRSTDLDNIGTP